MYFKFVVAFSYIYTSLIFLFLFLGLFYKKCKFFIKRFSTFLFFFVFLVFMYFFLLFFFLFNDRSISLKTITNRKFRPRKYLGLCLLLCISLYC